MPLRFLLCSEDVLSATIARDLCDRVVRERARAEWLRAFWAPQHRATQREWTGLIDGSWWSDRSALDGTAERMGVRAHLRVPETGRLHAVRGAAGLAYKALRVGALLEPRVDVVVISGDTEGVTDAARLRREGVTTAAGALPALVAEHHRESEAWVVAGFVPCNDAERERLRAATRELGFDPTHEPHRLLAGDASDPRDSKRVCRALLGLDRVTPADERTRACWLDTPLDVIEHRGRASGVADYLAEVARVLLPLLGDDGPFAP